MPSLPLRFLSIILGSICVVLGLIGVVLPVLPTTPFFLLAALLFARSSRRLDAWLRSTRVFKTYATPFLENQGLMRRQKRRILLITAVAMSISAVCVSGFPGLNFVVWMVLEVVFLWLLFMMNVKIPTIEDDSAERILG